MKSIEDALAAGDINRLAVEWTGTAFGIEAGRKGDHLVVGRRLGRDGTCRKVFIGVTPELQAQLAFRRLMAAAGANRHWENGPLVRWSVDFTVVDGQEAAVEARIASTAPRLETAFAWASTWDGINHNPSLQRVVQPGTYGVFEVSINPQDGRYLVRCPKGKQSPLKTMGAEFDYGREGWWIPDHQEDGLAAAMQRQVKAKEKADKAGPVVGYGDIVVRTTDRGYEVSFPDDGPVRQRLHAHVKGATWAADRSAFIVSHRNRQALVDWIEMERMPSRRLAG